MKAKYLLVDANRLRCQWVIVEGALKDETDGNKYLCGTVVMRGPDFLRGERSAVSEVSTGHSYLLGIPGTSYALLP